MTMNIEDIVPLTNPEPAYRGRYSDLDAQREYVECISRGIGFAASGHEGQWLYRHAGRVCALYPDGTKVSAPSDKSIMWINQAQKL